MYRKHTSIIDPEHSLVIHTLDERGIVRRVGKNYPADPATASDMLRDGAIGADDFVTTVVAYAMEFGYDMSDMVLTAHSRRLPLEHIALMQDDDRVTFAQQVVEMAAHAERMDAALAKAVQA